MSVKLPSRKLVLQYIYGYRGAQVRHNLFYGAKGEVAYFAAATGIVLNINSNTQRFYREHTDDIISMAMHPNGKYVATGQLGAEPFICVWDIETCKTVSILKGSHTRGICCLAFSNDGKQLASVGLDDNHSLTLWDWQAGAALSNTKTTGERVFEVTFAPNGDIITAGIKHLQFWHPKGNGFTDNRATLGTMPAPTFMSLAVEPDNTVYAGTLDGSVLVFKDFKLTNVIKGVHAGPVIAITYDSNSKNFYTGGKDNAVKVHGPGMAQMLNSVTLPSEATGGARSLALHPTEKDTVIVGTADSALVKITDMMSNGNATVVMNGHGEGELWGLSSAVVPNKQYFVTGSEDGFVILWNYKDRKCLSKCHVKNQKIRSVDVHPSGNYVVAGCYDGSVAIVDIDKDNMKFVGGFKPRKEKISQVRFSPDGKWLAVASHDNFVDIYAAPNEASAKLDRKGICKGATSFVTQVDFSKDSTKIQICTGDYEVLVYKVPSGDRDFANLDEATLATRSGVLGEDIVGIWPKFSDKTDINACAIAQDKSMLVTCDDFGSVKLFAYPVKETHAPHRKYLGHSAHVTNAAFTGGDSCLITTGGADQAVFQWAIAKGEGDAEIEDDESLSILQSDKPKNPHLVKELEMDYSRARPSQEAAKESKVPTNYGSQDVKKAEPAVTVPKPAAVQSIMENPEIAGHAVQLRPMSSIPIKESYLRGRPAKNAKPDNQLRLRHIFGYRGVDARENVHYTFDGKIAFPAAAAGVVYDPKTGVQKFFLGHDDDILCLCMHPSRKFVATGQIGKKPKVCVWNVETMQSVAVLENVHERGIAAIDFSLDGEYLVSVGLDDGHTMGVYQWRKGITIASGKTGPDRIFVAEFMPAKDDNKVIVACGEKGVAFYTVAGNSYTCTKGRGVSEVSGAKIQAHLSVAFTDSNVFTGTEDGDLYMWDRESKLIKVVPGAHKGPIFSLFESDKGYISGGADGLVKSWTKEMTPVATVFDVKTLYKGKSPAVRAVSYLPEGKRIAFGTSECDIYDCDETGKDKRIIAEGHGGGEVWGLAVHPRENVVFTAGDDFSVRSWVLADASGRPKLDKVAVLTDRVRSVAYNDKLQHVCAGLSNGGCVLLNAKDFTVIPVGGIIPRKETIGQVKYSPDGQYLAVGSNDNFVDIYKVSAEGYSRTGVCSGASSYITHVDWSVDSKWIRAENGAHEALYYAAPSGKRVAACASTRDIEWASWTGVLGPECAGIWSPASDYTDVNGACVVKDKNGNLSMCTADDFGLVKLFTFPALTPKQTFRSYNGHAAHVTNVMFTSDGTSVITTGGGDMSVMIWDHAADGDLSALPAVRQTLKSVAPNVDMNNSNAVREAVKAMPGVKPADDDNDDSSEDEYDSDLEDDIGTKRVPKIERAVQNKTSTAPVKPSVQEIEDEEEEEVNAYVAPRKSVVDGNRKHRELYLQHIFGYSSRESADNLICFKNGAVAYPAAGVGIVVSNGKQKFFTGHDDDITAMVSTDQGNLIATGQMGKDPKICVWDAETCSVQSILKGQHQRAISCLSFSTNGKQLISVGEDDDNTIVVWKWKEGRVAATAKGGKNKILSVVPHPTDPTKFVTAGIDHVSFWTLSGMTCTSQGGLFGGVGTKQTMLAAVFLPNQASPDRLITGSAKGELYEWFGNKLQRVVPAHKGYTYVLHVCTPGIGPAGTAMISGGKDGKVIMWSADLKQLQSVDVLSVFGIPPSVVPAGEGDPVRALDQTPDNKLLVGLKCGRVVKMDVGSVSAPIDTIACGHGYGELWGLSVCRGKDKSIAVTSGEDQMLRVWNVTEKKMLSETQLEAASHAVDISADGKSIAVGFMNGKVKIVSTKGFTPVAEFRHRKENISQVKFSPDGQLLAVGSHDNFIDIYAVNDKYKRTGVGKGFSSYIRQMDWSVDSKIIVAVSGAHEMLSFAAPSGDRLARVPENTQWSTVSRVLGHDLEGIWPKYADKTDINMCALSNDGGNLVTADDFGNVKYPIKGKNAAHARYIGHSSHVTNVAWLPDDNGVLSLGGNDSCLFLWGVKECDDAI